jgi:hypothetical protein
MCDIVFDKGRGWVWDKAVDDGSTLTYDNFTAEYVYFKGARGVGSSLPPSMSTSVPEPPPTTPPRSSAMTSATMRTSPPPPQPVTPYTPALTVTPLGTSTLTLARVEHNPVEFATPLSHDPLQYHTMENLLDDQPVSGLVPYDLETQLHLACDDGESRSFTEAERHAAWRAVIQSEMEAIEKNRT